MSYVLVIPLCVIRQESNDHVKSTDLKNGMRINAWIDRYEGDDCDGSFECTVTVQDVKCSEQYVTFTVEEFLTDERCELTTKEWVKLVTV